MTQMRSGNPKLLTALGIYLAGLALVAFWPTPVDKDASALIAKVISTLHGFGFPGWLDYNFVEVATNVAMFIPFGLLVAGLLPIDRKWQAAAAGAGCAISIEIGQELLRPERYATVYDVLANTLGAALGTVAAYAAACHTKVHRSQQDS